MYSRILVVDDDALVREFIVEVLNRKGYQVQQADSGEKAVEILKQQELDLIITDLKSASQK